VTPFANPRLQPFIYSFLEMPSKNGKVTDENFRDFSILAAFWVEITALSVLFLMLF
jgi:hypothetical protein